ncbi:hypothetical protein L7F22_028129 [Adiantum nelumboides]|nr:hypothetical protein [Adiantum nelumboides]
MPNFNPGDAVDLLDGGEVVAKGRVVNVDPHSYVHGMPMPAGHVSVSVVRYVNGTVYIPFPPPHDPESCRLADVLGMIIAWPRVALALENTVPTRSHSRQSHSRTSSRSSRGSKYSSMSEDDFEAEAARRGFERKKKGSSSEATSAGCFGDCFGLGSKEKPSLALETVIEDETDDNFEFRPHTQLQVNESINRWLADDTPDTTVPPTPYAAQTPNETPPETPPHQTLYYDLDDDGAPVSNAKGKRFIARIHELMWVYFPDDILTDWRRQPTDSKNTVINQLHREFPNPEGYRFRTAAMLSLMNHVLKSRRGMAREAADEGGLKPPGLSTDDWRRVLEERRTFPNPWEQQREANRVQRNTTGISRLGSGGKAHFMAKFKEIVGRKPTKEEYKEGRAKGMAELIRRMQSEGAVFTPAREERPGPSSIEREPIVGMETEDEDITYIPSEEDDSESEALERDGCISLAR